MLALLRFLMLAASLAAVLHCEDITIPLDNGKLLIRKARLVTPGVEGGDIAELSFEIENHTSAAWWTIELDFLITGRCNGEKRRWTVPATTSVGWAEDHVVRNVDKEMFEIREAKINECAIETIDAMLNLAQNGTTRIVSPELAKKEAAEAAHRKRLAAEQKRTEDEERAKAAEERKRVRAVCAAIYQSTADRKISDLTVKEEQQVRACQALGLYPPK